MAASIRDVALLPPGVDSSIPSQRPNGSHPGIWDELRDNPLSYYSVQRIKNFRIKILRITGDSLWITNGTGTYYIY